MLRNTRLLGACTVARSVLVSRRRTRRKVISAPWTPIDGSMRSRAKRNGNRTKTEFWRNWRSLRAHIVNIVTPLENVAFVSLSNTFRHRKTTLVHKIINARPAQIQRQIAQQTSARRARGFLLPCSLLLYTTFSNELRTAENHITRRRFVLSHEKLRAPKIGRFVCISTTNRKTKTSFR